jgi:hypothetical protein
MPDKAPKDVGAKLGRFDKLTGESGDEDGEGSERSDESVQDRVVVGDDSADSARVEVLSWCLWAFPEGKALGLSPGCESPGSFVFSMASFGSIIATEVGWSISVIPLSTS